MNNSVKVYKSMLLISPQHAHALELLKDQLVEGAKALDVGSGSGYLTACFARMVSKVQNCFLTSDRYGKK